jgi:hypothetical protein
MSVMSWKDPALGELLRALGAPKNVTRFELRVVRGKAVEVTCSYLPEPLQIEDGRIKELTGNFQLTSRAEQT